MTVSISVKIGVEWEGELETLEKLQEKLHSLEGITFEYK